MDEERYEDANFIIVLRVLFYTRINTLGIFTFTYIFIILLATPPTELKNDSPHEK